MSECYCCGGKDGQHKGPCNPVDWCKHGKYAENCEFCKETAALQAEIERLERVWIETDNQRQYWANAAETAEAAVERLRAALGEKK